MKIRLRPREDGAVIRKNYAVCLELQGVIGLYELLEPGDTQAGDIILEYDDPSGPQFEHELQGLT